MTTSVKIMKRDKVKIICMNELQFPVRTYPLMLLLAGMSGGK